MTTARKLVHLWEAFKNDVEEKARVELNIRDEHKLPMSEFSSFRDKVRSRLDIEYFILWIKENEL